MSLFTKYPTIVYPLVDENGKIKNYTITDVTTRINMVMSDADIQTMTAEYMIRDGETPETISYKLYGTPNYHWTIMHVNNIHDYINDWCKSDAQLLAYCQAKYGDDIDKARYYVDSQGNVMANPDVLWKVDSGLKQTQISPEDIASWHTISNYDYEISLNEEKRNIRVIRTEHVSTYIRMYNDLLKRVMP